MNVVGTVLLTGIDNPMCPGCDNYQPDLDTLRPWLKSLRNCSRAVIVHDELPLHQTKRAPLMTHVPAKFIKVEPTDENLFFQRWRFHRDWLREATDVDKVFLTDGSDVRMLNPPWDHMDDLVLYVGSEEDTISNQWILAHHPSLRSLIEAEPQLPLLNAGLLGGHRVMVLAFLDVLINRFDVCGDDMTDMGAFNLAAYGDWRDVFTGYPVHTRFNAHASSDPEAWWAHK